MAGERGEAEAEDLLDLEAEHALVEGWLADLRPGQPWPLLPACLDPADLLEWCYGDRALAPLAEHLEAVAADAAERAAARTAERAAQVRP